MRSKQLIGVCAVTIAIGATSLGAIDGKGPDAKGTVTLTGCLQGPILPNDEYSPSVGGEGPRGASGTTTYRLTNVSTKAAAAGSTTYLLVGTEKQMSPQLGHQVQIVGTTIAPPTGVEPTLRVESVRMMSAKCSPRR